MRTKSGGVSAQTQNFVTGDTGKPILSLGKDFEAGGLLRLEKGASYYEARPKDEKIGVDNMGKLVSREGPGRVRGRAY